MDAVERYMHKGLLIQFHYDQDTENPYPDPGEDYNCHITYKRGARETLGNEPLDFDEYQTLCARKDIVALPVYAYIHSGVALHAGYGNPFPDPMWDSGQSGIAYFTKAELRRDHGWQRITAKRYAQVRQWLTDQVECFGQWLNGECYFYQVYGKDGVDVDSCGGYIGWECAKQEAESAADYYAQAHPEDCYPDDVTADDLDSDGCLLDAD